MGFRQLSAVSMNRADASQGVHAKTARSRIEALPGRNPAGKITCSWLSLQIIQLPTCVAINQLRSRAKAEKEKYMTHEAQNVAREHAIAARTALQAFRRQQPVTGVDWSSFDTAAGLLDQTIEELRRPLGALQPALVAAGGFPAAMAYLIEEILTAAGPDMEFRQCAIDAERPFEVEASGRSHHARIARQRVPPQQGQTDIPGVDSGWKRTPHSRPRLGSWLQARQNGARTPRSKRKLPTAQSARRHGDDRQRSGERDVCHRRDSALAASGRAST